MAANCLPSTQFSQVIYEDEFNSAKMNPEWQLIDPKGESIMWDKGQGYLEMSVEPGIDLWWGPPSGEGGNLDAPKILMAVRDDFAIETRLSTTGQQHGHGGLLVWKNPEAFLRFEKTSCAHAFRGDVRFESHLNRVLQLRGRRRWRSPHQLYLRLERHGNLFSAFCATDPTRWVSCGQTYINGDEPVMVGLHALCPGNLPPTSTRFEYFRVQKRQGEYNGGGVNDSER